jgi:hypothetical protein
MGGSFNELPLFLIQRGNNMTLNTKEQISAPTTATLSTSSLEILPALNGTKWRRVQMIIINTSAATNATIVKGSNPAIATQGIFLIPNGSYLEGTDGGFTCWQGAVQAVGSGAGTISIIETKEALD